MAKVIRLRGGEASAPFYFRLAGVRPVEVFPLEGLRIGNGKITVRLDERGTAELIVIEPSANGVGATFEPKNTLLQTDQRIRLKNGLARTVIVRISEPDDDLA